MSFLRLGVACAVRDEQGRILLSKRNDLNVWNLPSGRLDSGELITDAAIREVYEETGVHAEITRVIDLYYYQGWQRMNILFEAKYVGGDLKQETFETRENRFFDIDNLPDNNISEQMVSDVLNNEKSAMRVITISKAELWKTKLKLQWRWVKNLLRGHIEPQHVQFNVYGQVSETQSPIQISGDTPIWRQLNLTDAHQLHHIRQNMQTDTLHFIFNPTDLTEIGFSSE